MRQYSYKYLLDNYIIINHHYVIEEYNEAFRLLMDWTQEQYIQENIFRAEGLFNFTIFLDELKYKTVIKNYQINVNQQDYWMDGVWNAQDQLFIITIKEALNNG